MIRVLVVDDSALVRKLLAAGLSEHSDIEVIGSAVDPYAARDKIIRLKPDVITLDLEMPRMDGLSFLAKLMKYFPLPVVVVSSLTAQNSELALRALELGAIEVIQKPGSGVASADLPRQLAQAVRIAAKAKIIRRAGTTFPPGVQDTHASFHFKPQAAIVAIGASTGGTQALERILTELPPNFPGTAIVQHMPEHFTATFAARLNELCRMEIREARHGDEIVPGVALIAPGGKHITVMREGQELRLGVKNGPMVHHQRPSVDVLFSSIAAQVGPAAVGVLLTGMGVDGAKGLLAMRSNGAFTIVQDEATSIVWGMPGEAVRIDAACQIAPLDRIAPMLIAELRDIAIEGYAQHDQRSGV